MHLRQEPGRTTWWSCQQRRESDTRPWVSPAPVVTPSRRQLNSSPVQKATCFMFVRDKSLLPSSGPPELDLHSAIPPLPALRPHADVTQSTAPERHAIMLLPPRTSLHHSGGLSCTALAHINDYQAGVESPPRPLNAPFSPPHCNAGQTCPRHAKAPLLWSPCGRRLIATEWELG